MNDTGICKICGSADLAKHYTGPVRHGKFGELTPQPQVVLRCEKCGSAWLVGKPVDYKSSTYREMVDAGSSAKDYYCVHDGEQAEKLKMLGTDGLRDKVIADIGCGAGSFLDAVKGFASTTLGAEPAQDYATALREKGHRTYAYATEMQHDWASKVDLAVCFSVVEHVEDPVRFLSEIRSLLKPGGRLLLSTPNRDDWLLELLPADYALFFYRTVHRWYFDAVSLRALGQAAGFNSTQTFFHHRFDLSNFLLWLRDHRPSGLAKLAVSPVLDAAFRQTLINTGRADYLYAWLTA